MSNFSPYKLKDKGYLSASEIVSRQKCEAMGAYSNNFEGFTKPPSSMPMLVGIVKHYIVEVLGNFFKSKVFQIDAQGKSFYREPIGVTEYVPYTRFVAGHMSRFLDLQCGARGPKDPPLKQLPWRALQDPTAVYHQGKSLEELIKIERNKYIAEAFLLAEAIRLMFTQPMSASNMHFEYDFKKHKMVLSLPEFNWQCKIHGVIDNFTEYPDGSYDITDYKSGWIVNLYKDRIKLIEDIQMTLYWMILTELKNGIPPKAVYIQPLDLPFMDDPWQYLKDNPEQSLTNYRINVPLRDHEAFRKDLLLLAYDERRLVEYVVSPEKYSTEERMQWEPKSSYAQKAKWAESVKEGRFKPRPGEHCKKQCIYLAQCKIDHADDWKLFEGEGFGNSHLEGLAVETATAIPNKPKKPNKAELNRQAPTLFKLDGSPPLKKAAQKMKAEMLESHEYVYPRRVACASAKELRGVLQSRQGKVCDCTAVNLYPLWLLKYLYPFELAKLQKTGFDFQSLVSGCPRTGCPSYGKDNP